MKVQPTIGVPALYFVTKTEATQESPTSEQWAELKRLWDAYIQSMNHSFSN
jgi:hypothetical protein